MRDQLRCTGKVLKNISGGFVHIGRFTLPPQGMCDPLLFEGNRQDLERALRLGLLKLVPSPSPSSLNSLENRFFSFCKPAVLVWGV